MGHFPGRRRQPGNCSKPSLTFWPNYWDKPLGHFPGWLQLAVAADLTVSSSCLAVAAEAYWDIFRVDSGVWMRTAGVGLPPLLRPGTQLLGHFPGEVGGTWAAACQKSAPWGETRNRKSSLTTLRPAVSGSHSMCRPFFSRSSFTAGSMTRRRRSLKFLRWLSDASIAR